MYIFQYAQSNYAIPDFARCRISKMAAKTAEKRIMHISLLLDMLEFNVVYQNVHFPARPIELRYSRYRPMTPFQDGRQNGGKAHNAHISASKHARI